MKQSLLFVLTLLFISACDYKKGTELELNVYDIYCDSDSLDAIYNDVKSNTYIAAEICANGVKKTAKMRLRGDSSREYPKKSLKLKVQQSRSSSLIALLWPISLLIVLLLLIGYYYFRDDSLSRSNRWVLLLVTVFVALLVYKREVERLQILQQKKVFNFNAEYKDPSLSHSYMSSMIFKELNYPCYNSSFAQININDSLHGIFLEIENMDKGFLMKNGLNPEGDLYKATKDGACLYTTAEINSKWEKKTNKKSSWEPLIKLIEDISNLNSEDFEDYIKREFDYSLLVDYLAANIFIANGSTNYHNYYLYRDIENNGKWMFIPWDLDKTLSYYDWKPYAYHFTSSNWENDNPLIEKCYLNKNILQDVRERLKSFDERLGKEFYEPILEAIQSQLIGLVLSDKTDKVNTVSEWKSAINIERKFLNNRASKALSLIDKFPLSFEVYKTAPQLSVPFDIAWKKAADSLEVTYKVYLSKDKLFEKEGTRIFDTNEGRITISEELELGTYYWKVVAHKGDLNCDGFNSRNSLELRRGTTLPDEVKDTVVLNMESSPYIVPSHMKIHKTGHLILKEGVVLLMGDNAEIEVHGGLQSLGKENNPVLIEPLNAGSYFNSIYFHSSSSENLIEHTQIREGLINTKRSKLSINYVDIDIKNRPMQFGTKRPSIIWGWYGDIDIDNLVLRGNKKGEGININWAKAKVSNSYFYDVPDAIEYINVSDGVIDNNIVVQSPDDAIDLNGCANILISNNTLVDCADKGISVGAEQYGKSVGIRIVNNKVLGNKIGLSVKDSSNVVSANNIYAFNDMAFKAYVKQKSYALGGEIVSSEDCIYDNSKANYTDAKSVINIDSSNEKLTVGFTNGHYYDLSGLSAEYGSGGLVIHNKSKLDLHLYNWRLLNTDKEEVVRFNKADVIPANEYLYIGEELHTLNKKSNYKIVSVLEGQEYHIQSPDLKMITL